MGKKKKEHITFDQMPKTKKSIPISKVNRQSKVYDKGTGNIKRVHFGLNIIK